MLSYLKTSTLDALQTFYSMQNINIIALHGLSMSKYTINIHFNVSPHSTSFLCSLPSKM